MKKRILSLFLVAAAGLHPHSFAQSVQDNCNAVTSAAVAGRDQANSRISNIESVVQQQAAKMRSCMESFSDAASRQALVIGGFDLAPLRNRLMDQACNMIQSQVAGAQQSISTAVSQLPQVPTSVSQVFQSPSGSATSAGSPQQSIWNRISCRVSGTC